MKILILAYEFPPLASASSNRAFSWFKYLPEHDISVTVVTRNWPVANGETQEGVVKKMLGANTAPANLRRVVRANYKPNLRDRLLTRAGGDRYVVLRKLLSYLYLYIEYLSFFFDAKANIYYAADKLLGVEKFDYIVATGGPFILFKYASLLSSKYNVPWAADYRDVWTMQPGESEYKTGLADKLLNTFNKRIEKRYIKNALFVSTVAPPPYLDRLVKLHPGKKVALIYNGYFEEYFSQPIEGEISNDKLTIIYSGTIYPFQKAFTFLEGVKKMLQQRPGADIRVVFYGLNEDYKPKLKNWDEEVAQHLVFYDKIPVNQLAFKLRSADLLLLLSGPGVDSMASKVFDYLAARRKIMLVENDHGPLEQALIKFKAGEVLNNAEEVSGFLIKEYDLYLSRDRKSVGVESVNTGFFSRRYQAGVLAGLLKDFSGKI
ncbi:MAG TPA: hypothetical protein VG603_02055 [Chitinophagales bacterium]|nr:hypothetical protein [Chitinophagales bacterium]